jgi:hypothetical protein
MRKRRVHLVLVLVAATIGCSLAQIAHLPPDLPDKREPGAVIATCLSSIGMREISHEWPASEIIANDPGTIAAWDTPPPESKWDLFLDKYKGALAWVQVSEKGEWSVRFVKHDKSFPLAFSKCMSRMQVPVSIESDWYFDLS